MSIESVAAALNCDDPELTPTDRLVLVGICNHDGDGGAWPAIRTLARYTGVTTRTVQRSISKLIDRGHITRHEQQGGTHRTPDHGRPNLYDVHIQRGDTHVTPPLTPVSPRPPDTSVTPPVTPMSPEPSMNHPSEPSTKPSARSTLPEIFEWFWDQYPRRVAKADALKAWSQMTDSQRIAANEAIGAHVALWRREGRSSKTVPYPATWLRRESWDDELAYVPERAGGGSIMERIQRANGTTLDSVSSLV